MNGHFLSLSKRNVYLSLLTVLFLPVVSNAQTYDFKVVYAEVPGIDEIVAGDHDKAIEILETRTGDTNRSILADELATLCALYIVKGKLAVAQKTCDSAVEADRSHTAYNNRGVLRVHLGDPAGAIEDFDRARVLPQHQKRYVEELMMRDARLIATSNYAVAKKMASKRKQPWQALASSIRGASVEDIN
jgi:tetratricopeptide (TPR) repeat protein